MNIASYIERTVRQFPDQIALRINENEATYSEFNDRARSLAQFLDSQGLKKGDKLGIFMPNIPDYLITMYAVWILGGIAVPINYRFQNEELTFVFEDSGIKWIVALSNDYERVKNAGKSLSEL